VHGHRATPDAIRGNLGPTAGVKFPFLMDEASASLALRSCGSSCRRRWDAGVSPGLGDFFEPEMNAAEKAAP